MRWPWLDASLDIRLNIWRLHLELRLYVFNWRLRLGLRKWQWNPWVGPIEPNVYWPTCYNPSYVIDGSASIRFTLGAVYGRWWDTAELRLIPPWWRTLSEGRTSVTPWMESISSRWGPFWFYASRYKRDA